MSATRRWTGAVAILLAITLSACSSGSSTAETPTTRAGVARVIARQTRFYERARLTHAEAACLANVTGRMKPAGKDAKYVIGTSAQSQAIDRCNINPTRLGKVGPYIDSHPPESN